MVAAYGCLSGRPERWDSLTKGHSGADDGAVTQEEETHGELKIPNPFRDPVRRRMASMALPAISRMLRVGALNRIVQDSLAHIPEMNGPDAILHTMGASSTIGATVTDTSFQAL